MEEGCSSGGDETHSGNVGLISIFHFLSQYVLVKKLGEEFKWVWIA